ncbi:MAG: sigma-54 dependent transcriptional regulator [Desulfobacterales bacterium]|jgi:DNA-binding NtrC family response regulator
MKSILVTTSEQKLFRKIRSCFPSDCRVESATSKQQALDLLLKKRFDLVFIELNILTASVPDENYKEALQPFWQTYPTIEIIVMAPQSHIRKAVRAVKDGASDYLPYPIDTEEVKHIAESINESIIKQSELNYLRDQFWHIDSLELIQTKSSAMKKVFDKIRSVSPTKSTVLLAGDTGTGKNVLAKLIHQHSNRGDAQFIIVHCGAIPDTLVESEMFGHEKGAFTGAIKRKLGKFEIAHGGTIFLDEIGTITPSAQIKLLQILQDGTFQRVGGEEILKTDVRVIAATNADLKKMCAEGQFRKDLYYRLNVFPIEIPALSERIEDIPLFIETYLRKLNSYSLKKIHSTHPHVLEAFSRYSWPGNIRELENLIERAYILETSAQLTPESFPNELFESDASPVFILPSENLTLTQARQHGVEEIERNYLKDVLARHKGKIGESAEAAGISTRQLNKLMNKYGIRKEEFKSL